MTVRGCCRFLEQRCGQLKRKWVGDLFFLAYLLYVCYIKITSCYDENKNREGKRNWEIKGNNDRAFATTKGVSKRTYALQRDAQTLTEQTALCTGNTGSYYSYTLLSDSDYLKFGFIMKYAVWNSHEWFWNFSRRKWYLISTLCDFIFNTKKWTVWQLLYYVSCLVR